MEKNGIGTDATIAEHIKKIQTRFITHSHTHTLCALSAATDDALLQVLRDESRPELHADEAWPLSVRWLRCHGSRQSHSAIGKGRTPLVRLSAVVSRVVDGPQIRRQQELDCKSIAARTRTKDEVVQEQRDAMKNIFCLVRIAPLSRVWPCTESLLHRCRRITRNSWRRRNGT
jgi:hypothetical protein